jgi:hypothetical protein
MTEESGTPAEQRFEIEISAEVEQGLWADFVSLWHTPDSFVLDFAALRRPPYAVEGAESHGVSRVMPARIVGRVRIPPSQVFELMKALEQQLSMWEQETGRGSTGTGRS